MDEQNKPLSEATSIEEFKTLRAEQKKASAEPAEEKTPQSEEDKPVIAAESGTAGKDQEKSAGEKSLDDQIKELRGKGQAPANKLEREAGAAEARKSHEAETARLKQELETLRNKPVETPRSETPKPATPQSAEDAEPQVNDDIYAGTGGYDKYMRDVARWEGRKAAAEERIKDRQATEAATIREKLSKLLQDAKAKYQDFDAVTASDLRSGTGLILTPAMQEFVRDSDVAMDVMYHLGKNHDDYVRIFMLPAGRQMAELGKLEDKVSAVEKPTPVTLKPAVSRAAAPPRILSGADTPEPKGTSEARTFEDFKSIRRKLRAS